MQSQEDFAARLKKGHEFAPALVGLNRQTAVQQILLRGYRPQLIPPTADAITADLDSRRIRLFMDEDDMVVRATAG